MLLLSETASLSVAELNDRVANLVVNLFDISHFSPPVYCSTKPENAWQAPMIAIGDMKATRLR